MTFLATTQVNQLLEIHPVVFQSQHQKYRVAGLYGDTFGGLDGRDWYC